MKQFGEAQYIHLVKDILQNGVYRKTRNGNMKSIFGTMMKYDLRHNTIPLLTSKKVAWKTCLKELMWFINGGIFNEELQSQGVHIWDSNASNTFLESRNLGHYKGECGELGPIYGFQWRNFNGDYSKYVYNETVYSMTKKYLGNDLKDSTVLKYIPKDVVENKEKYLNNTYTQKHKKECVYSGLTLYRNTGIDQLQNIITILQGKHKYETKYSRRLIVSAWNPVQLDMMALPPCHVMFQFQVSKNEDNEDELNCSLYQRSGDVALGIPFNIASYSFLTHIIAHLCDLKPGMFIHHLGDVHMYEAHEAGLNTQIERMPLYEFPTIQFNIETKPTHIEEYSVNTIDVVNYIHHPTITFDMVA